jgi:hypothetical protein
MYGEMKILDWVKGKEDKSRRFFQSLCDVSRRWDPVSEVAKRENEIPQFAFACVLYQTFFLIRSDLEPHKAQPLSVPVYQSSTQPKFASLSFFSILSCFRN